MKLACWMAAGLIGASLAFGQGLAPQWDDWWHAGLADEGGGGVVSDGLVLYLDAGQAESYPGAGTNWYDLSGNGNTAGLFNGLPWNTNGWFTFGRFDTKYAAGAMAETTYSNATFGAWVYQNDGPYEGAGILVSAIDPNLGMGIISYDGCGLKSFYGNTGQQLFMFSTQGDLRGHWNYLARVYDGDTGVHRLYVYNEDGEFKRAVTNAVSGKKWKGPRIGRNEADKYWDGRIAVVFFYGRALNEEEVEQNYDADKARFGL